MKHLNLVRTKNLPILKQLQLEEALLRADSDNWCLINEGTPPAIVLGSSSKVEEHLTPNALPWIRRFSGGGVVVVNEETLFFTLICQSNILPVAPFPKPVLNYVGGLLQQAVPEMLTVENDYTWRGKKVGGNAQYFVKGRFLHHTSLLWDYSAEQMNLLKMPPKMPEYREKRAHSDFVVGLREIISHKEKLIESIITALQTLFTLQERSVEEAQDALLRDHRRATTLVNKN